MLHQNMLVANGPQAFQINPAALTLDARIRQEVITAMAAKKQILLQAYPDLVGIANGQAQLDAMPWPTVADPHFTDLITKFKNLKVAAMGTGLYIGNNLVITAAHCVTDLGPQSMGSYSFVFNLTDGSNVPAANVFNIRR
jgi:hypothetical protein